MKEERPSWVVPSPWDRAVSQRDDETEELEQYGGEDEVKAREGKEQK